MTRTGKMGWTVVTITCTALVLTGCLLRLSAGLLLARFALTTGPSGAATPASLEVPFEHIAIPSGNRRLDSYVVAPRPSCPDAPVLLIYHGTQETISDWVKAQQFLFQHCVASVVFDPSGSGNSSRSVSMQTFEQDALSAYRFTHSRFPGQRFFVLGHSMGNGVMLEVAPQFCVPPDGTIVANAFPSLRKQGFIRKHWLRRTVASIMPDWWNNVRAVKQVHVPLLVVHSDADQVNPLAGGEAIYVAANQPKAISVLHGFSHNALSETPSEVWWSPVLSFIKAPK